MCSKSLYIPKKVHARQIWKLDARIPIKPDNLLHTVFIYCGQYLFTNCYNVVQYFETRKRKREIRVRQRGECDWVWEVEGGSYLRLRWLMKTLITKRIKKYKTSFLLSVILVILYFLLGTWCHFLFCRLNSPPLQFPQIKHPSTVSVE